jgi:hypothetical protein
VEGDPGILDRRIGMKGELERARRLLKRMERDMQALQALLDRLETKAQKGSGTPSAVGRGRKQEVTMENPASWRQVMEELWEDFQKRGQEAVHAFVERHTLRFLVDFLRVHSIPVPGKGRPSKSQIREELYQCLRERRVLNRPVFSSRE